MTQALLNDLNNNIQDTSFVSEIRADGTEFSQFDKIFQVQKELETTSKVDVKENIESIFNSTETTPSSCFASNLSVLPEPPADSIDLLDLPDDNEITDQLHNFIQEFNPYVSKKDNEDDNSNSIEESSEETEEEIIDPVAEKNKLDKENKEVEMNIESAPIEIEASITNNVAAETFIQYEFSMKTDLENTNQDIENEGLLTSEMSDLDLTKSDYTQNNTLENIDLDNIDFTNETKVSENTSNIKESENKNQLEEIADEEVLRDLNIESIEAESPESNGDSDLMKNQTPQEQGVKAMLHADIEFKDINFDSKAEVTSAKPVSNTSPEKIIEQITKQLESLNSNSKVNIVLNPESLGKVSIQLINTKEGLSAQFTVATQEARNLILKDLEGLKETLLSQGVSVDNVSVKLNETQDSEYSSDWTEQEGSKGGNKEQRKQQGRDDKQNFEQMFFSAQIENDENGNV